MAFGFLIAADFFSDQARIQSGIIRSKAQSPPPITFPALAVAIFGPFSLKKDSMYAFEINSAQAFEAL